MSSSGAARALLLVATFQLARLGLAPHAYVWLLAVWVTMCAVLGTRTADRYLGVAPRERVAKAEGLP